MKDRDRATRSLAELTAAYERRRRGEPGLPVGWLLAAPEDGADALLEVFEHRLAPAGAAVVRGAWREGMIRPYGGLLELADRLAARVVAGHPELLRRYGSPLANLVPSWRRAEPLERALELRSGLADFVLRGEWSGLKDFYWKRNVAALVTAELVHLCVEAAAALAADRGAPTVLVLEDLDLADDLGRSAAELLARYAGEAPILLCATARGPLREELEGWCVLEVPSAATALLELTSAARKLAEATSVLTRPFGEDACGRLGAEEGPGGRALRELVEHGVLCAADGRLHFAAAATRRRFYDSLDADRRQRLHARALEIEGADPFSAAWHAGAAELAEAEREASLRALERAWAVSDHASALALGERVLAADRDGSIDHDLLRALLYYDAGQNARVETFLQAALARGSAGRVDRNTLERLLGYNALFGLGDLDRGRGLLEKVLARYEAEGREEEAGYVRNSIAFALFRAGRIEEAMALENATLERVGSEGGRRGKAQTSGFLCSILQLNLGRLNRTVGESDRAIELFRRGMEEEFSPYMLLIFLASLAHLHEQREEHAEALETYHRCLEMARDLDLENTAYPVYGLLAKPLGKRLLGRLTRGDEVFFYLYLHLAMACRRVGLEKRAESYLTGLRRRWPLLPAEVWEAAGNALAECEPAAAPPRDLAATFAAEAGDARRRYGEWVEELADERDLAGRAVALLAEGRSLAILRPREIAPGVHVLDSVVLHDPRPARLARQVQAEVGVSSGIFPPASGRAPATARSALALPAALAHFRGAPEPLPLVMREATLVPGSRDELAGLGPYRVRVETPSRQDGGFLREILERFADQTGVGVLAAVPFHLRRRAPAATAERALGAFLMSSLDGLVLGKTLLVKRHGAAAARNLLPARPYVLPHVTLSDDSSALHVRVRAASYSHQLRLSRRLQPLFELCDGRRSVAEVARSLREEVPEAPSAEGVCGFLRELQVRGVLSFDEPTFAAASAEARS